MRQHIFTFSWVCVLLFVASDVIGNESVPKIKTNDAINSFFKTPVSILPTSKHNTFRVLFDKIVSVIHCEKNIY